MRLAFALVAAGLIADACGVPIDQSAHSLPASELPKALSDRTSTTTTRTVPNGTAFDGKPVILYFLRCATAHNLPGCNPDLLAPQTISVKAPVRLSEVLAALEAGPTTAQVGGGNIRTDLFGAPNLHAMQTSAGVANIGIQADSFVATGEVLTLEVAQVVYTAIDNTPGVKSVQFWLNGIPYDVPSGDGITAIGAVDECDYNNLLPKPRSCGK